MGKTFIGRKDERRVTMRRLACLAFVTTGAVSGRKDERASLITKHLEHYRAHLWRRTKDPVAGFLHAFGALLAVAGLVYLIVEVQGRPWQWSSFIIYGITLVVLYTASALYHLLKASPKVTDALFGFDRAAIYALIAGTYTPICLIALPTGWGWSLLGVVWGLALTGIVIDIISRRRAPDWVQAVLYLLTGWVALAALGPLVRSVPPAALVWLLIGSLIYTGGAVICVMDKPKLRPGLFSAHELWHCLVLAGSACHFVTMFLIARHF